MQLSQYTMKKVSSIQLLCASSMFDYFWTDMIILSNFLFNVAAWPALIDEFVEYAREKIASKA